GAARRFDSDVASASPGMVDYVVGAAPAPGGFVLATCDDPRQRRLLELYKLGEGPLYCFHNPCHLCHFEVPNSIARMALFADVPVRCAGAPRIDVVATAKRNLARGDVLDGIGGFCTYGQCEDANAAHARRLLPLGLAEGARIIVDKPRDSILTWDDVDLPRGGAHLELRRRQDVRFFGSSPLDRERPS
ncbi:MAG: NAD(P)-dependent oxidoreductase, partial [Proteobacteria bacterium]